MLTLNVVQVIVLRFNTVFMYDPSYMFHIYVNIVKTVTIFQIQTASLIPTELRYVTSMQ